MAAKKKKPAAKKSAPAKKKVTAKKAGIKKVAKVVMRATKSVKASSLGNLLTPLDDRIVIAPAEEATTTPGGLIIPLGANDRPVRGHVLATGPGRRNKKGKLRPLDVNVGDEVLFAQFSGTTLTFAGKDVLILREEDVLGVVI